MRKKGKNILINGRIFQFTLMLRKWRHLKAKRAVGNAKEKVGYLREAADIAFHSYSCRLVATLQLLLLEWKWLHYTMVIVPTKIQTKNLGFFDFFRKIKPF